MYDTILQARYFALAAHEAIGQKRKYTNEPYFNHVQNVARLVRNQGLDDNTVAAAFLHDVLEDTKVSYKTICDCFGSQVANMVFALTNVDHSHGNRAARHEIDKERLANADGPTQSIKVADLIDNTSTIVKHDPKFARVYLPEKMDLLKVLTKADPVLRMHAITTATEASKKLEILQ